MSDRKAWIDVSVPLRNGMVHWPGDPPVRITRTTDVAQGDRATVSRVSMGSHTGTHMDAPRHFLRRGKGIDRMPLTATIGPARVLAIRDPVAITPEELRRHRIHAGERVLFKTRNSARCWRTARFVTDFVFLSRPAAAYLAAKRLRAVGVDYLSVGGYKKDGADVHRILLRAGIWIIEGLNLSGVRPGTYELCCLPLRMADGDGAPARAALRPR